MAIDTTTFWAVTALLGLGTFLIRLSFLGLLGGRTLPGWLQLHLKYTAVAVFPALVTPLVLWPAATDGALDAPRIIAALVAFIVGLRVSIFGAMLAGMGSLYVMKYVLG